MMKFIVRLIDVASVIRSKNAGPLQITLDILFPDATSYALACSSNALKASALAERYEVEPNSLSVIHYHPARAIKVVIDRPLVAGTPGDSDVYGAQQHHPLLDITL
jgi:hypothetical protein